MMFYCPVCGRRRFVHQPQFWPYRFDGEMFCSENCWICDSTRKIMERKGFKMARMKKDGTPAKKPGPKAGRKPNKIEIPEPVAGGKWEKMETPEAVPEVKLTGPIRIETPEANRVEVVETPESAEPKVLLPATYDGMVIREVEGLFGRYRYSGDLGRAEYIDFENSDGMDTLSLTVDQWKKFREEQVKAALILGVRL